MPFLGRLVALMHRAPTLPFQWQANSRQVSDDPAPAGCAHSVESEPLTQSSPRITLQESQQPKQGKPGPTANSTRCSPLAEATDSIERSLTSSAVAASENIERILLISNDLFEERGFEPPTPWSRTNNRCTKLLFRLGLFCVLYRRFA